MKVNKSQLFKMAHAVMKRTGATLSEALKMAWKAARIYSDLLLGEVKFTYRKLNGEIRNAVGTLKNIDYLRKTTGNAYQRPADVLCYFDIEKKAFRSFTIQSLI